MCARYTLHHSTTDIAKRFQAQPVLFELSARYNIAPSQPVLVVKEEGGRTIEPMRWGLVPFWAKDPEIGNRLINARAETLPEKPAFKNSLTRRRCIIPSDGFYEWKAEGKGKQPVYIRRRDGELFGFAGLWDEWLSPDGSPLRTCIIITTAPNALVSTIHDRMPVILTRKTEELWLDPAVRNVTELMSALRPYGADDFEAYPVSRLINSPTNEGPACVASIETA